VCADFFTTGRLLLFAAESELSILRSSAYIVCDGTFEMAPESAYQLYTLHGCYHGEWMPLVFALLPNKSEATYTEMFRAIRDSLTSTFGDTGCDRTFVTERSSRISSGLPLMQSMLYSRKQPSKDVRSTSGKRCSGEYNKKVCSVTTRTTRSSEGG